MASKPRQKKEENPYSATINLPITGFEMRANAVVREPELQEWWRTERVYERLCEDNPGEAFTLHDGPPYANGDLHIGHALNKILKDIVNRYQLLQGRRARFVPGWDCHGLPIELKVLQSMPNEERRGLTPIELRRKAAEFALRTVDAQREQFKRYGIWADWDTPYLTMTPAYEAAQLRLFGRMVLNGHIYRGKKPVHWSPSSRTALAEAELEYPAGHVSRSVYVAMPLEAAGPAAPEAARAALEGASLAIWTTTPWTMPGNLAVGVNAGLEYCVVEVEGELPEGWKSRRLVVATALVPTLSEKLGATMRQVATLSGAELTGSTYRHPMYDRISPVVEGGDYITTESGTGLVHTAPGHGQEDYQVGLKYGLPLLSPVDDAGRYTEEAGAPFAGLSVLGEGNAAVIEALRQAGALLAEEGYPHKYPYDWRTKQPTIFRATEQWFASLEGFRDAALAAISSVEWTPTSGEHRIRAMTEGRADWCISRQRSWGVPIPVFFYMDSGEALMTEETIEHVAALVQQHGSNAWWELPLEGLLPEGLKADAPRLRRGDDTMDVWFDSGSSWAGVLGSGAWQGMRLPADLYLEGSDQHRGWFQSSLLTSVAATGVAPYKQVLTHGFVLDEQGFKMSKSVGNVVDPRLVISGGKDAKKDPPYGADVLRLWVSSVDYSTDVLIGGRIISQVADVYRKLRFTLRFLLGNLHDFDPAAHTVPYAQLAQTDRYVLARFAVLVNECTAAYQSFHFYRVYQALQRFVVLDLSSYYLDVSKDRLYISAPGSKDRRSAQSALRSLLGGLLPLVAPLAPHMAEDAWRALPHSAGPQSVFEAGWARVPDEWRSFPEGDLAVWQAVLSIRGEVNQLLEKARADKLVGSSLEAKVWLHTTDPSLLEALQRLQQAGNGQDELRYAFIVSDVALESASATVMSAPYSAQLTLDGGEGDGADASAAARFGGEVLVGVSKAGGSKCGRCWNYSTLVGAHAGHPTLCERCTPVVEALGAAGAPAPQVPAGAAQ